MNVTFEVERDETTYYPEYECEDHKHARQLVGNDYPINQGFRNHKIIRDVI